MDLTIGSLHEFRAFLFLNHWNLLDVRRPQQPSKPSSYTIVLPPTLHNTRSLYHPADRGSKEMKILTKYSTKGRSRLKTFYREMNEKLCRVGKMTTQRETADPNFEFTATWRTCILSVFNLMYLGCLRCDRRHFREIC